MSAAKHDGGSAFLVPDKGQGWGSAGMSLRDWFAGQIAAGMAAHSCTAGISYGPGEIAGRSYEVADALLKAREAPYGE